MTDNNSNLESKLSNSSDLSIIDNIRQINNNIHVPEFSPLKAHLNLSLIQSIDGEDESNTNNESIRDIHSYEVEGRFNKEDQVYQEHINKLNRINQLYNEKLEKIKQNNNKCKIHGNEKEKKGSFVVNYEPYDDFFGQNKSPKKKNKSLIVVEVCTCTNEDNVEELISLKHQFDKLSNKND